MNLKLFLLQLSVVLAVCSAQGQSSIYIYDQQSATNAEVVGYGAPITQDQPVGQSFTPTLSSVGFVQLEFDDTQPGNSLGATVYLNLWSGSISNGTLLASTGPVYMPDSFGSGQNGFGLDSVTNFFFATPVSVTPGATYYIQPVVVQPGSQSLWTVADGTLNYSGGTFYAQGEPNLNGFDLWFREGIIEVPEPSCLSLIIIAILVSHFPRRKQQTNPRLERNPCAPKFY